MKGEVAGAEANVLIYGDNLTILRSRSPVYVQDESVDLIYLDPPFNSQQDYNVLFQEQDGTRDAAQIQAFNDTWRWDKGSAAAFHDVISGGGASRTRCSPSRRPLATTTCWPTSP